MRSVTASLTQQLTDDWRVGANLLMSDGRVYVDFACSALSCPSPDLSRSDYRSTAISAFAAGRLASNWGTTLRLGNSSIDYNYPAFDSTARTDSRTRAWQNTIQAAGARWLFGIESLDQKISGEGLTTGATRYLRDAWDTESLFGAWGREFGAQELRIALRRDRIEAVGAETTGAFG